MSVGLLRSLPLLVLLSSGGVPSLAAPLPAAGPGPGVTITVEDPCPALAARGRGKSVRIGGVSLDLEALYFASCDYLKDQIAESVGGGAEEIQGTFTEAAWGAAEGTYREFLVWVRPVAAQKLGIDPASPGFDVELRTWLTDPETAVVPLVDQFLAERAPRVGALLERLQADTSREIAEGLGTLWDDAKDRFDRFTRAYSDIEREPDTPYADVLETWGLSGPWLEKLQSYEDRLRFFDDRTRLLDSARTLYEALSADRHRDRIEGLFSLLETVGDAAQRSDVPGVSFFGQVVALYGQLANELLRKVDGLEDLLRRREGHCIGLGTHTLEEERSVAFRRQFGDGLQACPVDLLDPLESAIYQQTEPADADQLYFWLEGEGRFVKGQPRGGGMGAVLIARRLIVDGARIGFDELEDQKDDLGRLSAFTNTPYHHATYGDGLAGVWSEAVATIDGIGRRLGELELWITSEGDGCDRSELFDYVKESCDLDAESFPRGEEEPRHRLTTSFALGVVAGANPRALSSQRSVRTVERYRRAWECLRTLSLLRIDGAVRQKGSLGRPCTACSGTEVAVRIRGGVELPGCSDHETDDVGRFRLFVSAPAPGLSITLSAEVDGRRSDTVVVNERSADLQPFPFGVRTERVVIPVDLDDDEDGEAAGERDERDEDAEAEPARIRVPDLTGLSVESARARLRVRGLALAIGEGTIPAPTPHLASRVGAQSPQPGSGARRGDRVEVTLYAATTIEELLVPSLVGLTEGEALERLREARLTGEVRRSAVAPSPRLAGRVYAQHPLAGTRVGTLVTVRVHVYSAAGEAPPVPTSTRPPRPTAIVPTPTRPPSPPPRSESPELAGTWDTGRGMVVRFGQQPDGTWAGTLVRVTKPIQAFYFRPGDRVMTGRRTGPGTYAVTNYVRFKDGRVQPVMQVSVVVRGDTAQAAKATWTRVGPP